MLGFSLMIFLPKESEEHPWQCETESPGKKFPGGQFQFDVSVSNLKHLASSAVGSHYPVVKATSSLDHSCILGSPRPPCLTMDEEVATDLALGFSLKTSWLLGVALTTHIDCSNAFSKDLFLMFLQSNEFLPASPHTPNFA